MMMMMMMMMIMMMMVMSRSSHHAELGIYNDNTNPLIAFVTPLWRIILSPTQPVIDLIL